MLLYHEVIMLLWRPIAMPWKGFKGLLQYLYKCYEVNLEELQESPPSNFQDITKGSHNIFASIVKYHEKKYGTEFCSPWCKNICNEESSLNFADNIEWIFQQSLKSLGTSETAITTYNSANTPSISCLVHNVLWKSRNFLKVKSFTLIASF